MQTRGEETRRMILDVLRVSGASDVGLRHP